METIVIFIAKKFFIISPIIAAYFFYKLPRESQKNMLIFAFFSLPMTFILSVAAKDLYFNPLPFVVQGLEPLIDHAPNNGFPSDHTLLLAAIASIFSFFHKKVAVWLWLVVALVGLARVYVGVHHFVDIAGGVLIALLSAFIVHAIMLKYYGANNNTK